MGAVNGVWCVRGGLRCAAAPPPVFLFGARPEQPPGLVVQEKESYIALCHEQCTRGGGIERAKRGRTPTSIIICRLVELEGRAYG